MGAGSTPAGWYPDAERPGGERYWNGTEWTEDRRLPPTSGPFGTPGQGQPIAPAGYAPFGAPTTQYPSNGLGGWALGLSIGGLFGVFCCGVGIVLCIPGTIMGWIHLQRVQRGEADPGSRGLGLAAVIVGGIGTALFAALVVYIALVGISIGASA